MTRSSTAVCRIITIATLVSLSVGFTVARVDAALLLCAKKEKTGAIKDGGKIVIRSVCKVSEQGLGPVSSLQTLLAASSSPDGGATVQLTGNFLFASPLSPPGLASIRAAAPAIGETNHFCVGGGFPATLGNQFPCTANTDCSVCLAGNPATIGATCTSDPGCNSANKPDGQCATAASCQEFAILAAVGSDLVFSGFNVNIRSGAGSTDALPNGRGNLIVGYNEATNGQTRDGSNNLVVGSEHEYRSYGGMLAGFHNSILESSEGYASVSGGEGNTASAQYSSVSGGVGNTAGAPGSSVSGGAGNTAIGSYASVSGGLSNTASGGYASVSGGLSNTAIGSCASVSGGEFNTASEQDSSVSGGSSNTASGDGSSVSGGSFNTADGQRTSVSGGYATGAHAANEWHAGKTVGFPTYAAY
jgi:hypothetical protein